MCPFFTVKKSLLSCVSPLQRPTKVCICFYQASFGQTGSEKAWKQLIKIFAEKKVERRLWRFCSKKEAWKKVIKILLKRSLKEGNKDKKEESEENKRSFSLYK